MFKKILYILFLLLIVVFATEYGLRWKGTYKTYAEKTRGHYVTEYGEESDNIFHLQIPNAKYHLDHGEFNYEFDINSSGFREREFPTDDSLDLKVFVFGDSYTEGVGAPYDSTWPRQLERLLVRDFGNAGVFVCGVSGGDPFFNYSVLRNIIGYHPTHVIFCVNSSDLHDYSVRGGMSRFFKKRNYVVYNDPPRYHKLYRKSHLARMVGIEALHLNHNLIPQKKWPAIASEAVDSLADCLWWADANCTDEAIKFMTVIHPNPRETCGGSDLGELDLLGETLDKVRFVNITQGMSDAMFGSACETYFWPVDGHYNSKGYGLMGDVIYGSISDQYPDFWSVTNY